MCLLILYVLLRYLILNVLLRYEGKSINLWNIFSDSNHGQETDAHGNHPDCNYDESNLERKQKNVNKLENKLESNYAN